MNNPEKTRRSDRVQTRQTLPDTLRHAHLVIDPAQIVGNYYPFLNPLFSFQASIDFIISPQTLGWYR